MTYTFADGGDGALKILQDGVEVASIDGDEVSIFKNTDQSYVELSDSEHVFFAININQVSGATTLQDIVDAIEAALPNESDGGGAGVSTFSALTDAYDLSGVAVGTVPMRDSSGNLIAAILFDKDPVTAALALTTAITGTYNYDNGAAGVGATLTRTTNGALGTIQGVAASLNQRYLFLFYTGANRKRNGLFKLTQIGDGSNPPIFTRDTDSDETSELHQQVVLITSGTFARRIYSQTTPNPTIGTSNIVYSTSAAGGGNIRSDGSVDFTATETWDDGSGSTIAISPTSIVSQDGGVTGTTTIGPNSAVLTDGTGITTIIGATIVTDGGGGVITGTMSSAGIQFSDSGSAVSGLFTTTTLTLGTATETLTLVSNSVACDNTLRIRTTANNGDLNLDPNGTGKVTCTKDIAFSDKVIDTTAGDSATINSPAGRFRKDTTGTTFTLTNSYSTLDSIIMITLASDPGDPSAYNFYVTAADGSFDVTFEAAPANNTDVNFLIIN